MSDHCLSIIVFLQTPIAFLKNYFVFCLGARSSSEFRYCQIGLGASLTPDTKGILSGALGIQRQKGK